jgi:lysylphosphatidylglycerol synthetase-like protein (DUF2156 family)
MADTVLIHPNRDKAESQATRAAVLMLLLVSAGILAIVTVGGWSKLAGAQVVAVAIVIVYVVMAFYVSRWNRGVLPVAAGLAVLMAILSAVSAPGWFDRDKSGFANPALDPAILGLLTVIFIPVCLLLIAFAMRGFQQKWNVEVEVAREEAEGRRPRDFDEGQPSPAG